MGQSTAEPAWETPAPHGAGRWGSFPSPARKASTSEQVVLLAAGGGCCSDPLPRLGRVWAGLRNCSFLCVCSFPFPLSLGFPQWGISLPLSFPSLSIIFLCLPRVSESRPVSGHGSDHRCGLSPASFLEAFSLALVCLCQSLGLSRLHLFPGDAARSQASVWKKGK